MLDLLSPALNHVRVWGPGVLTLALLGSAVAVSPSLPGPVESSRLVSVHVSTSDGERETVLSVDRRGRGTEISSSRGHVDGKSVAVMAQPRSAAKPVTTSATGAATAVDLATTATNTRRTLVLLTTWTAPDAVTEQSARQRLIDDNNRWLTQVSYGAVGVSGDVTPWLQVAGPDEGKCFLNSNQVLLQAKAAAAAAGYDVASYDNLVLYFPKAAGDCGGFAGWGYYNGSVVVLNGTIERRTSIHEFGHNLGLSHAAAFECYAGSTRVVLGGDCRVWEYGDMSDAMGNEPAASAWSTSTRSRLGWLSQDRVADLSAGGSRVLSPAEGLTGLAAAKIVVGTRTYWFEHRVAVGPDAALPASAVGGVQVRASDPALSDFLGLLDATPGDDWATWQLTPGSSFRSPEGVQVTAGQRQADGLPITVTILRAPSAPANVTASTRQGTVKVSWSTPASDGGSPVTGYAISLSNGKTVEVSARTTSASFRRLATGVYVANVAAGNAVGRGPAATSAEVTVN